MASRKVWEQREARWARLYGRKPSRPLPRCIDCGTLAPRDKSPCAATGDLHVTKER